MDVNLEQKINFDNTNPSASKLVTEFSSEPVIKKPRIKGKDEQIPLETETNTELSITEESKPGISKKEDSDEESMNVDHDAPTPGFKYPLDQDASDILEELEFNGHFPSVTERYFTPYYELDVVKPGDDICIRIHSNRICMISLAPSHVILQENKTIQSCNYKVSEKLDRTTNKVSGKAKHGAQPLQSNSNLCCLTCTDGSSYMVKCCMIGKLVEVNTRLIDDPELLKLEPHFGGYIAIVLPNLKHLDKLKEKLLNQASYEEAIMKRKEKKEQELLEKENNGESTNKVFGEKTAEDNFQQINATVVNSEIITKELPNLDVVKKTDQDKEKKEIEMDVDS